MNSSELDLLTKEGECLTVELKESYTNKIDRDMVAFANTSGGRILLGVTDKGKIIGEKLTNKLKADINCLARNCDPSITLDSIKQVNDVIVIEIPESNQKPHSCSAGYYRRLDGATQKMNQNELKLVFKNAGKIESFEMEINKKVAWENISTLKIEKFLAEADIQLKDIKPQAILNSLCLAEKSHINNAGVLFFADEPRQYILQCEMILAAFKGSTKVHIYDRIDVRDDLITQFNTAMIFLRKHLNVRSEITGINRKDICEIPLAALREAVINAIIHRDYSTRGMSIMVEVYTDRVVIQNPGKLPDGMSIKALMHTSMRRNEIIADMFGRIDKAERMGSGIKRILDLISDANLPEPIFDNNNLFFNVTFKRDPQFSINPAPHEINKISASDLTDRQHAIIEALHDQKLSSSEILEVLTVSASDRTVQRELQLLKDMGYIDFEGPKGWARKWFVVKE